MIYPLVDLPSSYKQNNLGVVLRDLVIRYKPSKIIEFGVLHAYSSIHMAQGLQQNLNRGHIIACDLWGKYDYNHTTMDVAQKNIDDARLSHYVTFWQADYYQWLENPCKFNLLHLDLSNDGDIIEQTLTKLAPQIDAGAVIIFEGGSKERDNVDWMKKYNKRPINPLQKKFGFEILDERFPSISIATKSCLNQR